MFEPPEVAASSLRPPPGLVMPIWGGWPLRGFVPCDHSVGSDQGVVVGSPTVSSNAELLFLQDSDQVRQPKIHRAWRMPWPWRSHRENPETEPIMTHWEFQLGCILAYNAQNLCEWTSI